MSRGGHWNVKVLTRLAAAVAVAAAVSACVSGRVSAQSGTSAAMGGSRVPAGLGTSSRNAGTTPLTNWTVYHADAGGSGVGPAGINLSKLKSRWTSPDLGGGLYGEPLVWHGAVYVATENDTVYALSGVTGKVIWWHHLATAVPSSKLPCGNIGPRVGITSTPVIDVGRNEIFVVADELVGSAPRHELFGLSLSTGNIELSEDADPAGVNTAAILQRAALTLDGARVVFAFGGNYGDCSTYHGWVESVPVAGGSRYFYEVDHGAGEDQGAIWMGGAAPIITSKGDIFVAVGNGSVHSSHGPYDDSDSVLELSSTLAPLQYFAPSTWASDNANDLDLGSMAPAVLPNGLVVQAGKSQTMYLLDAARLGGIGGQMKLTTGICGNDVDGGVAFVGSRVYLPCESGIMAVQTDAATKSFRQIWRTPTGAGGPPIVAGGDVWSISGETLYALNTSHGAAQQILSLSQVNTSWSRTDFPTPSVGDGLLLATSTTQVHAFIGS